MIPDSFLVATKRLYISVCPSVRWSVTLSLFGLLGATYGRVSGLVLFFSQRKYMPYFTALRLDYQITTFDFRSSLSRPFARWIRHRGELISPLIHNNASRDFLLKTAALPVSIGLNCFSNDFFEESYFIFPAKKTQKR